MFRGHFGHFLVLWNILVIIKVSRVFCHFLCLGVFWSFFLVLGDILVIFRFLGYFGHFLGFRSF